MRGFLDAIKKATTNPKSLVLGTGRAYSGNFETKITLDDKERSQHVYVIGATRSGKTKAVESWIRQDINAGRGIGVIDPHGDLTGDIIEYIASIPNFNPQRLIYIDPANPAKCAGFNPLEVERGMNPYSRILELIGAFKKIWADSWGARMEEILRNTLHTLAVCGLTLLEAARLLTDNDFRDYLLSQNLPDDVKDYWQYRFNPLPPKEKAVWIESSLNKINAFCADPYIRSMIGQTKSTFDFRDIMDNGKILLVNLSKGKLKENAFLLGALLLAKIQMAALSRTDMPKSERLPWYLYVDEFQNFATDSFAEILSESAKFGLSLTLAHQNLDQLRKETPLLRGAILGNAGTHLYFRISREDAEILAKEIFTLTGKAIKEDKTDLFAFGGKNITYYTAQEEFEYYCRELTTQGQRQAYLRKRSDKEPYLFTALEVNQPYLDENDAETLIEKSFQYYAKPRSQAEELIQKRREEINGILKQGSQNKEKQKETNQERKQNARGEPLREEDFFK